MDLENELRQAMAEHVSEMSAPRALAAEAKRRHHRTVRRRTAFVVGAAGVVVGVAMIPTYQSFRPQTVGADGRAARQHGSHASGSRSASEPPAPTATARPDETVTGLRSSQPSARPRHSSTAHAPIVGSAGSLLGYLPPGIDPDKTCQTSDLNARQTTTCRWSGSGGWVEVKLVRDGGLQSPADLGLAPPTAIPSQVHGHPALRGGGPTIPSQIMWVERRGVGVWVSVSSSLRSSLTRVAEGVNVP